MSVLQDSDPLLGPRAFHCYGLFIASDTCVRAPRSAVCALAATKALTIIGLLLQVREGELKTLAAYLYSLEDKHGGVQHWVECDNCKKWRLVDAAVEARATDDDAFQFKCADDSSRPVRGCDVVVLPGESGPTEDEALLQSALPLLEACMVD